MISKEKLKLQIQKICLAYQKKAGELVQALYEGKLNAEQFYQKMLEVNKKLNEMSIVADITEINKTNEICKKYAFMPPSQSLKNNISLEKDLLNDDKYWCIQEDRNGNFLLDFNKDFGYPALVKIFLHNESYTADSDRLKKDLREVTYKFYESGWRRAGTPKELLFEVESSCLEFEETTMRLTKLFYNGEITAEEYYNSIMDISIKTKGKIEKYDKSSLQTNGRRSAFYRNPSLWSIKHNENDSTIYIFTKPDNILFQEVMSKYPQYQFNVEKYNNDLEAVLKAREKCLYIKDCKDKMKKHGIREEDYEKEYDHMIKQQFEDMIKYYDRDDFEEINDFEIEYMEEHYPEILKLYMSTREANIKNKRSINYNKWIYGWQGTVDRLLPIISEKEDNGLYKYNIINFFKLTNIKTREQLNEFINKLKELRDGVFDPVYKENIIALISWINKRFSNFVFTYTSAKKHYAGKTIRFPSTGETVVFDNELCRKADEFLSINGIPKYVSCYDQIQTSLAKGTLDSLLVEVGEEIEMPSDELREDDSDLNQVDGQ